LTVIAYWVANLIISPCRNRDIPIKNTLLS
jgi:hypothetical protein